MVDRQDLADSKNELEDRRQSLKNKEQTLIKNITSRKSKLFIDAQDLEGLKRKSKN